MNTISKAKHFRQLLNTNRLLRFPGAFNPLCAMLIERLQFDGIYISGAVLSNDLGLPDIGLTTQTEVAKRGQEISRVSKLPAIIDADTGFGEPLNVARTINIFEDAGLAGLHLEDQQNPKRCGHLDYKTLVSQEEMARKIKIASTARRDSDFVIIARRDARASEGLDAAVKRAIAYQDAGADIIFPEALQTEKEFEQFRKAIDVSLLANMTEFGKSPILNYKQLSNLGFNIVIYPVTTLRLAMKAAEEGLKQILEDGTQEHIISEMQTRQELYDLLGYEKYNTLDNNIYNFKIK